MAAVIWQRSRTGDLFSSGMTVILVGHAEIKRFDSPETEPYDRYQPKLHARASALI